MLAHRLTTMIALLLLVAGASAYAGNSPPPPASPASPPLDVTMRVVPLNADIEKAVVQTIVVPMNETATKLNKTAPRESTTVRKSPAAPRIPNFLEGRQARAVHQASEIRREAAEAAKEARKDRDNSSIKGHHPASPV